jgi:hypothetical protein
MIDGVLVPYIKVSTDYWVWSDTNSQKKCPFLLAFYALSQRREKLLLLRHAHLSVCRLVSAAPAKLVSVKFDIVDFMYIYLANADLLTVRQKYREFCNNK